MKKIAMLVLFAALSLPCLALAQNDNNNNQNNNNQNNNNQNNNNGNVRATEMTFGSMVAAGLAGAGIIIALRRRRHATHDQGR